MQAAILKAIKTAGFRDDEAMALCIAVCVAAEEFEKNPKRAQNMYGSDMVEQIQTWRKELEG